MPPGRGRDSGGGRFDGVPEARRAPEPSMRISGAAVALQTCADAALAGARAARRAGPADLVAKEDPVLGHHAIVSAADYRSQRAILGVLGRAMPGVPVVCEETPEDAPARSAEAVRRQARQRRFVVDELDGSASFVAGHHEWAVSVACVDGVTHAAGAVCAPEVFGGALFYAGRGRGAFLRRGRRPPVRLRVKGLPPRESYVLTGPDSLLHRYPAHNALTTAIASECRTLNVVGSCALAMALVAAGCASLLFQPLQSVWDWAAGRLLVEEAGGVVLFYEMEGRRIVPVPRLQARHYDPRRRVVGLVAGECGLAREALERLAALMP
jgi:myo-inositol-1(or 4)-monophosphatase